MEEMIYYENRLKTPIILDEGDYKGIHYVILNLGTHPCVYVENKRFKYSEDDWDYVHGGISFEGYAYWNKADHRKYLGWDYAHAGDYMGYYQDADTGVRFGNVKKWSTPEILEEVHNAIDHLLVHNG